MTIATRNAFIYGTTESIAEMVFPVALTAARYTVLAYDIVTSDEAKQTYRWAKEMSVALGQLAFWSVAWVYAKASAWVDANEMVEVDPFSPTVNPHRVPAMAQAMAAPVATLMVPVDASMNTTTAELRRQCQSAGIRWRNAHGKGKHLSKAEMIAALQGMDCWALSEGCLA